MSQQPRRVPKYRVHKGSGQAFVEFGRRRYIDLGKHGIRASRVLYDQTITE